MFRKLSVLMPIRNNCARLFEIVERIFTAPLPLELELIAVDGGSTDGSWELIEELAAADDRIQAVRNPEDRRQRNMLRTAIERMTGDVAVVHSAASRCDPHDYPALLEPILEGVADAVYGSPELANPRRVSSARPRLLGRLLRGASNLINGQDLAGGHQDVKMVRADVLRQLRLTAGTPAFETEPICRLAQRRARVYEVPMRASAGAWLDERRPPRPPRSARFGRCSAAGSSIRNSPATAVCTIWPRWRGRRTTTAGSCGRSGPTWAGGCSRRARESAP